MSERPELCDYCTPAICGMDCHDVQAAWDAGYARAMAEVRAALQFTAYEGMPESAELKETRRAVRRALALMERTEDPLTDRDDS